MAQNPTSPGDSRGRGEVPPVSLFPRMDIAPSLRIQQETAGEESASSVDSCQFVESTARVVAREAAGRSPAHGLFPPSNNFSHGRSERGSFGSEKSPFRNDQIENINVDDFYQYNKMMESSVTSGTVNRDTIAGSGNGASTDAVSIVDDAGSSVFIDDGNSSIDVRDALKVLDKGKGKFLFGGSKHHGEVSDFDEYIERVAREYIIHNKAKTAAEKRTKKRRPMVYDSRKYGNYFHVANTEPSGASSAVQSSGISNQQPNLYSLSYNFDNFNGARQNVRYNHQLNMINSKYTYEEQQRRRKKLRDGAVSNYGDLHYDGSLSNLDANDDGLSFMTMNIDEMSDGHEDDDDWASTDETSDPHVKRGLLSRQIQIMSLTGSFSVGILLNSGYTLFTSGPLSTLLAYFLTGIVTACTMASFGEMISLIPTDGTLANLVARFTDDSLGFTVGLAYWFSSAIALPAEITAAVILLSYYPMLDMAGHAFIVWTTLFVFVVLFVSLIDIRAWGEIQYVACLVTLISFSLLLIVFCAMNSGGIGPFHDKVGFRYWDSSKSNHTLNGDYGLFRPKYNPLNDLYVEYASGNGEPTLHLELAGIGGKIGRFLQFWSAVITSFYSYVGTEIVFTTAAEVRNPRKALPAATKKIFWRIGIFYILAVFLLTINIYAGDPRLVISGSSAVREMNTKRDVFGKILRDSGSAGDGELDLQSTSEITTTHTKTATATSSTRILSTAVAALATASGTTATVFSTGKCANSFGAYGFSYTGTIQGANNSPWIMALHDAGICGLANAANAFFIFFSLACACNRLYAASRTLYGVAKQRKYLAIFRRCSNYGIPWVAVLATWCFSWLCYLTSRHRTDSVFTWLANLTTSSAVLVWATVNFAFIRFFYGLKLRPDILGRNDVSYPYKSPFQPYIAYFGLGFCIVLSIFLGCLVFVRNNWDLNRFITDYLPPILFLLCYISHKLVTKSKLVPLAELDLDSCRKAIENTPWKEDRVYRNSYKELFGKVMFMLKHLRASLKEHDHDI